MSSGLILAKKILIKPSSNIAKGTAVSADYERCKCLKTESLPQPGQYRLLGVIIWFGEPYFTIPDCHCRLAGGYGILPPDKVVKGKRLTDFRGNLDILLIVIRDPTTTDLNRPPHQTLNYSFPLIITLGMAISLILLLTRGKNKVLSRIGHGHLPEYCMSAGY